MTSVKLPGENLDYSMDFASLLAVGETISTHAVTVSTGITLGTVTLVGSVVTAWLDGGTDGHMYTVTFTITTSAMREYVRTMQLLVTSKAPNNDDIAELRDAIGDAAALSFTANELRSLLFSCAINDITGEPVTIPLAGVVGNEIVNPDWFATFDFNLAASKLWAIKATNVIDKYDFSADGGDYTRSQMFDNFMKMSRHYAARRAPRLIRTQAVGARKPTGEQNV